MQRGRKPKPVALHKLEGTYSATRHGPRQAEPEAPGELADAKPPEWMTASQRKLWRELLADAPMGILRRADRRLFISYVVGCDHFETAARTQNRLDETGAPLLMRTASGSSMSTYLKVMIRYSPLLLQIGAELGFSPTARARLGQPQEPREPDEDERWARLRTFPVIQGGRSAEPPPRLRRKRTNDGTKE